MGVLDWLTHAAERRLRKEVGGTGGVAHVRYPHALGEAELRVRATIGDGHPGTISLRAKPENDEPLPERHERGEGVLVVNLGEGTPFRGTELELDADVVASGESPLAQLVVEIFQRERGGEREVELETFSVESRFDQRGHARLGLVVTLD